MTSRSGVGGRETIAAVGFAGGLLLLAGCSLPPLSTWHPGAHSIARHGGGHYIEVGTASWYGPGFHGGRTSSGEIYNSGDMTAAHPTLPLGTRVVVTNLENGRSVDVRINDRGPFVKRRAIDLSHAAARELALVGPGTASVRIESIDGQGGAPGVVAYAVQAGSFQDGTKASELRADLSGRFGNVYLSQFRSAETLYYRVRVGPFDRRDEALSQAQQISDRGLPAIIVEEVRQ